jgi:TatD DNase family protein
MWTDTHQHVADEKFAADRAAVIQAAYDAGVTTLVEIAESPQTWDAAVQLAESHPFIYASLGIHPHHAHETGPAVWPELRRKLRELLTHPKVVAVGEFGLDYFRMQNTAAEQSFIFRAQLELARELGKPIVIHCRDAHSDTQAMLKEFFPTTSLQIDCPAPNGVIHCFSGDWTDAQTYFAHGFMIGVDGPITYPSAKTLQETIARAPVERIVLETDSPYLPPQSFRGQRNDPSRIPVIGAKVAELKHMPSEQLARKTTDNARRLFRL